MSNQNLNKPVFLHVAPAKLSDVVVERRVAKIRQAGEAARKEVESLVAEDDQRRRKIAESITDRAMRASIPSLRESK